MNPLARRSLLMLLHIRKWTAEVSDTKALQIVANKTGADTHQDKYKKSLFVTSALQEVDRLGGRIRAHFYHETLPWADGGARLIPSMKFREYANQHKSLVRDFEMAVERFLTKYLDHKDEAEQKKGDLFIENEYPTIQNIKQKFAIELFTLPFPDIGDFRVEAPEEVIEELKGEMKESMALINIKINNEILTLITTRLSSLLKSLESGKTFKGSPFNELEHSTTFAINLGDQIVPQDTLDLVNKVKMHVLAKPPEQVRESESLKAAIIHNIKEMLNV